MRRALLSLLLPAFAACSSTPEPAEGEPDASDVSGEIAPFDGDVVNDDAVDDAVASDADDGDTEPDADVAEDSDSDAERADAPVDADAADDVIEDSDLLDDADGDVVEDVDADEDVDAADDAATDSDVDSDVTEDADGGDDADAADADDSGLDADVVECARGLADCDGDGSCETDLSDPALCGACGPLDGVPGEACGDCGTWTCDEFGGVVCAADDPNLCGGCEPLAETPGEACGECGTLACTDSDTVSCMGDVRNLCGGCAELALPPGVPCGPCEDGVSSCDGVDAISCDAPLGPDGDADGIPNHCDRCLGHPDSADADSDGTPDACDCDDLTCPLDATCEESVVGAVCLCEDGYQLLPEGCVDIDECAIFTHECDWPSEVCINEPGSYSCECAPGFELDGETCVDIDECAVDNGGCDPIVDCINMPGGRICDWCPEPLIGTGEIECVPLGPIGEQCEDPLPMAEGRNVSDEAGADVYPAYEGACLSDGAPTEMPGRERVHVVQVPAEHVAEVRFWDAPDGAQLVIADSCPDVPPSCSMFGRTEAAWVNHETRPIPIFVIVDSLTGVLGRSFIEVEFTPREALTRLQMCGDESFVEFHARSTRDRVGRAGNVATSGNYYTGYWNRDGSCGPRPNRADGEDLVYVFQVEPGLGVTVLQTEDDPNIRMAVTTDCYVGESCVAYANDRVDFANEGEETQTFYLFIDGVEPGSTTFGISGSVFAL